MRMARSLLITALASALGTAPAAYADRAERTVALSGSAVVGTPQTWMAGSYRTYLGVESGQFGIFPSAVFGKWNGDFGYDLLLGVRKSSDSASVAITDTITDVSSPTSTRTLRTVRTGGVNFWELRIGARPRFKVYRSDWALIYWGVLAGAVYSTSTSYPYETTQQTYSDRSDTANYTINRLNGGTIEQARSLQFYAGPVVGSEFYLPSLPYLALGFSTGVVVGSGGNVTTQQHNTSSVASVVNGVEQPPSSQGARESSGSTEAGLEARTYGLGDSLGFFSTFTLRYVW